MVNNGSLSFLTIAESNRTSDLSSVFENIAKTLFEEFKIIRDDKSHYCLTDIEFYLLAEWHQDFYTYAAEAQQTFGQFYRHDSGLDFTFGDKDGQIFAGILIRGIIQIENLLPVNGCWYVYEELCNKRKEPKGVLTSGLSYEIARFRSVLGDQIKSKRRKGLIQNRYVDKAKSFSETKFPVKSLEDIDNTFLLRNYRFCL